MKITTELAFPIVNQLMSSLDYNINIMDERGFIVASGDQNRLNKRHEGAVKVIQSRKELIIAKDECASLPGTKNGVNLPIEFHDEIIGVVGITGDPEDIYKFANVVKMSVEVLLSQIYIDHQTKYHQKAIEGWVVNLTDQYEFDERRLSLIAKSLQINCTIERSIMIISIDEIFLLHEQLYRNPEHLHKVNELKERVLNMIHRYLEDTTLCLYIEESSIFLAVNKSKKKALEFAEKLLQLLQKMKLSVWISIGSESKGVSGYRESYLQAKQSMKLLHQKNKHTGNKRERITHIDDWGVISLLDNIPETIRKNFISNYLPPKHNLSAEYEETLLTFLESDLNVKKTAEKIHIHRNTLLYRLDRISKELQLDPRKFNEAIILKILYICTMLNNKEAIVSSNVVPSTFLSKNTS